MALQRAMQARRFVPDRRTKEGGFDPSFTQRLDSSLNLASCAPTGTAPESFAGMRAAMIRNGMTVSLEIDRRG